MPLELFRNDHVGNLRRNAAADWERYTERKPWAGRATGGVKIHLRSGLELAAPLELELPDGGKLKDLENAKIVHAAFPDLTPLQARDPRLWTRLTHVECWAYMRKRWDVGKFSTEPEKAGRFVLSHYFISRAESRMLLRNGIARLWWYAYLTHDSTRDDPYELTAELLSYLDIAKVLLETNMGRAPHVRTGFLDFLRNNGARLGGSAEQRRKRIRDLAKLLNLRGGITLLDCLTKEEVTAMLDEELRRGASV